MSVNQLFSLHANIRYQTPGYAFSTAPSQYEPRPLTCGGGSETETDPGTEDEETEDEMPVSVAVVDCVAMLLEKPGLSVHQN